MTKKPPTFLPSPLPRQEEDFNINTQGLPLDNVQPGPDTDKAPAALSMALDALQVLGGACARLPHCPPHHVVQLSAAGAQGGEGGGCLLNVAAGLMRGQPRSCGGERSKEGGSRMRPAGSSPR